MPLGESITLSRPKQTLNAIAKLHNTTRIISHLLQPQTPPTEAAPNDEILPVGTLDKPEKEEEENAAETAEASPSEIIDIDDGLPDTVRVPVSYFWGIYWTYEDFFIPKYSSATYEQDMKALIKQLDHAQTAMISRINRFDRIQILGAGVITFSIGLIDGIVTPYAVDDPETKKILSMVSGKAIPLGASLASALGFFFRNKAIAIKQTAIESEQNLRDGHGIKLKNTLSLRRT